MPSKFDVIVIGGGIAGTSVAAQLAKHCKVVLLEMEKQIGYHATGRSAAYYAPSYGNEVIRGITAASGQFFLEPDSSFTDSNLIKLRPSLFVAKENQGNSFHDFMIEHPHLKTKTFGALKDQIPLLKDDAVVIGALDTSGGDLDVDAILQGFYKKFIKLGGELKTNAKVKSLKRRDGLWHVNSEAGEFSAPIVINAAGAWADPLAELAGLGPLGVQALKRTALLVDAPCDISDWPIVIDIDEDYYFKPDAGQLLISPADESPSNACDAYAEEMTMAIAIDRVQSVLDLEVTKINHHWAGLRSFSKDKTFIVGFDPRSEGFFWLAGQGGYGVQTCPALADIAACQISGSHSIVSEREVILFNEAMAPDRFI